ncbi:hypothetical protein, partial [Streptomyces coelicoflavus]|uniref:hypothetical protein n=1 Tax=Streptomyces coelicoflavus TaxID=285562 RepID=UPI001C3F51B3
ALVVAEGEKEHGELGDGSGNDDVDAVPGDGRPRAAVAYRLSVRDPARAPTEQFRPPRGCPPGVIGIPERVVRVDEIEGRHVGHQLDRSGLIDGLKR